MWWASGGPIVKPRQITNMALGVRVMGGRGLVKGVVVDLLPICPFSTRFPPNFVGFLRPAWTGFGRPWRGGRRGAVLYGGVYVPGRRPGS